ncbi:hypothetical protein [Marinobacterium aestuarii]|nr:hypothetical protein [Marinobacterium aestuarii]
MKCQKNLLSSLVMLSIWLCLSSAPVHAGQRDDLYAKGIDAYGSKNYVVALKNLYAFYVLNEAEIDARPDFKKQINERIVNSEAILKLSFAANPSIQASSGVTRIITRNLGGSFIGTGMEVEDLLKSKTIDLKSIQDFNHKSLAQPVGLR